MPLDIWSIDFVRQIRSYRDTDGELIMEDVRCVLNVWVLGEGMLRMEAQPKLAEDWPKNAPKTAIDAVASAIAHSCSEVRSSVNAGLMLSRVSKKMEKTFERRRARAGRDADFAEMVHRSVEQKEREGSEILYQVATLSYEPEIIPDDEEISDESES